MKILKPLLVAILLQSCIAVEAIVYFAPVQKQADLQSTDSFQIVIAHTRAAVGGDSYVWGLTDADNVSAGSKTMKVTQLNGTYFKSGNCNYGTDTLILSDLQSSPARLLIFHMGGNPSEIWGYHGAIGEDPASSNNKKVIYTYRPSASDNYASKIGSFLFDVNKMLINDVTGNVSITRSDNESTYKYMYGTQKSSTSSTLSLHFGFYTTNTEPNYSYLYRVFRRIYHPTFLYKETSGNDFTAIERLIPLDTKSIFTFDKWKMPAPTFMNDWYKNFIEIIGWKDAFSNLLGVGGESMDYAGYMGEDITYTLHYRVKRPISISGYVDYVLGDLMSYATIDFPHVALINDSTILPHITLHDTRYHVILNGWKDTNGTLIGVPGDTVRLNSNTELYPDYTIIPFHFTFDGRRFGTPVVEEINTSGILTLPYVTWNIPTYAQRLVQQGWFDVTTDQFVGMPGEVVQLYEDMSLYMRYAANTTNRFIHITSNDSLKVASGEVAHIIILNDYANSFYALQSDAIPMHNNNSPSNVSFNEFYYSTNGESALDSWNNLAKNHIFSIDLTQPSNPNVSYNNNRFIWSIISDSNTYMIGYNGYMGSKLADYNADNSIAYTYANMNDDHSYKYNFSLTSAYAMIDWVGWNDEAYRYLYKNTNGQVAAKTAANNYNHWRIFRQIYDVHYEVKSDLLQYGTCIQQQYVFDSLTLPMVAYSHNEYAQHIDIKGWYDENDEYVGMPGDNVIIHRNIDLHLEYAFHDFFTITFNAKDHGTCETTSVTSILPFQLPEVVAENGYQFKGWVSGRTDEMVGQSGSIYPKNASVLSMNDSLYAIYEKSYEVLEWGTNSLIIEFLNTASTAETQTTNGTKIVNVLSNCETDKYIYNLQIYPGDLRKDEGQELTITFKDANKKIISQAVTHIPIIVAQEDNLITNHDPAICTKSDLVILDGGIAIASPTAFTFQNIHIQGGGKLIIPTGTTINTHRLHMHAGTLAGEDYQFIFPEMVVDGSLNNKSGIINYEYVLNDKQYYNLSLPYDVNLTNVTYRDGHPLVANPTTRVTNALWIAYYDGATRAMGMSGWKKFAGETIQHNVGYTVSATPETVRPIGGNSTQRKYAIVRFPMQVDLSSGEPSKNHHIQVYSYPSTNNHDNDAGWNLVGNPYFASYGGTIAGLTNTNGIGLLVDDGQGGYEWQGKVRYVVLPNNQGTAYVPMIASAALLPAFNNFFVQIGEGDVLEFSLASQMQNNPNRMVFATSQNEDSQEIMTGIKINYNGNIETVGILLGNHFTEKYEINADLQKWLNPSGFNFYALGKDNQLSFIALNADFATNIPIGYSVPGKGFITITADDSYDVSQIQSLILTDLINHQTVDLLKEPFTYYFNSPNASDNQFILSVIGKVPSITTDTEEGIGKTSVPSKILYNNRICILRNAHIFDLQGALLK